MNLLKTLIPSGNSVFSAGIVEHLLLTYFKKHYGDAVVGISESFNSLIAHQTTPVDIWERNELIKKICTQNPNEAAGFFKGMGLTLSPQNPSDGEVFLGLILEFMFSFVSTGDPVKIEDTLFSDFKLGYGNHILQIPGIERRFVNIECLENEVVGILNPSIVIIETPNTDNVETYCIEFTKKFNASATNGNFTVIDTQKSFLMPMFAGVNLPMDISRLKGVHSGNNTISKAVGVFNLVFDHRRIHITAGGVVTVGKSGDFDPIFVRNPLVIFLDKIEEDFFYYGHLIPGANQLLNLEQGVDLNLFNKNELLQLKNNIKIDDNTIEFL
jgi:hypothetical protein